MLQFSLMLLLATSAFLVTVFGFLVALKLFPKIGLLDFPERYGLSRARVPYPAGIISILVFLGFFLTTQEIDAKEIGVVGAVLLLGTLSFLDDRTPLPAWVRLLSQVLVAIIVFAVGARIYTITHPMGGILKLDTWTFTLGSYGTFPILSGVFTIAWLMLTINAMNWFDGIAGQVHVISTIGFLMIGCLALFRNGEPDIATLSFILAAISGAGLMFDFPPGRLLIGDTGAMFFGLLLGLLGIYEGGKVATAFLAVGLPLFDALIVIVRRLSRGQSPFSGGRDHLHHLLLDRGWSPKKIILLTASVGSLFGITALFLNTTEKAVALVVLLAVTIVLSLVIGEKRVVSRK